MTYTKELALLNEKAEMITAILERIEVFTNNIESYKQAIKDDPTEKEWRQPYIDEYKQRISALEELYKLLTK